MNTPVVTLLLAAVRARFDAFLSAEPIDLDDLDRRIPYAWRGPAAPAEGARDVDQVRDAS